jgi:16S rRNA (cytosine1402-N4)-methyltransferase
MTSHITVLKNETIEHLNIVENGVYVDATFGGGGHTVEILSTPKTKVIAIDVDIQNIANFQKLSEYSELKSRLDIVHDNFSNIIKILKDRDITQVDGVLADLGWSSDQLDSIAGLSYQDDSAILDMRMNSSILVQAKDILNTAGKDELSQMFFYYADFRGNENQKIVDEIRKFRSRKLFSNVGDLKHVCDMAFGLKKLESKARKHTVYSRVFQALRIKINDEYTNLEKFLSDSFNILVNQGRICIITFHSGEEKIVTNFINQHKNFLNVISKSQEGPFIRPSIEELTKNLRARSAKLFVIEKKL